MSATSEATGDALGDTIGGMFDIPEQHIVEQMEDTFTIGDDGKTDKQPEAEPDMWYGW
ncbi:MAG: hypothetical protein ACR2LN_05950 [Candidatus Levyibacteriota bacterium]